MRFLKRYPQKIFHYVLLSGFIASFFSTAILISPYSASLDNLEKFSEKRSLGFGRSLISTIPKDTAVVATFKFLPPLSQRRELYSFHQVYMGTYTLSRRIYILPKTVEYALLDMVDSHTFDEPIFKTAKSPKNLKEFFLNNPWQVIDFAEDVILLKKGKKGLDPLYQVNPPDIRLADLKLEANLNDEIQLDGITIHMGSGIHEGHARFTFYWKCLKKTAKNYGMILTLVDSRGNTFYEYTRHLCYRLYPTSEWNPGDTVVENYWFIMPQEVPEGAVEVRVGAMDMDKMEAQSFASKMEGKVDAYGRVKLETFEPY